MDGKRYNTLNRELKRIFGEKVMKLSLDGGFTCPNRDGTLGTRGCIFCSEEGSGEFAGSRFISIKEQVEQQKRLLSNKWNANKYIAYFQNFTNTYGPIEQMKKVYNEALEIENIVGLAIATRPDCINDEVLELLESLNKRTFLWLELGLQSIHDRSEKFIRRGYPLRIYEKAVEELKKRNIKVVTHLIVGLPNEDKDDILSSVDYVAQTNTWGIKLHSLYIQKGTDIYNYYINNPYKMLTKEEYVDIIVDAIELLPGNMIVHRVTGDAKKEILYEPKWSADKLGVISSIDKELKVRKGFQGQKYLQEKV
ncbi:TIGR01212 family radical SAM protein [Tissierella sp. Yu-01]|uniref:TIGR01212 family radical SAM protein n=1 Tax=Tissierella sp. Yu-01 TaxID=3035694 RepID=UPI00240D8840|nr:TIGR01212 family radical SAM protein [Tissierella sp. Yu-01]WFA08126.1 TIGR01212 family radical SAM protein [Tissierella sp. Yu-01]